jgi:Domain of unknown function (DUF2828)
MMSNYTRTDNNALSHATTGNARVDFFFRIVRDTGNEELINLLQNAHAENIDDTIKLVFHLRDCRGGKGEKKQFLNCIRWYARNGFEKEVIDLLGWIPYYGYWKDLLHLLDLGGNIANAIYTLFANALRSDKMRYDQKQSISLCAKYAPTESGEYDKKYKAASEIAKRMGITLKRYRREFLVPLRAYSNVTEVWMCSGKWEEIPYEKVASVCMHKNKKAFLRHDSAGFQKYLELVKSGDQKINASQLFPHQLILSYVRTGGMAHAFNSGSQIDPVVEEQWKSLVQHCKNDQRINIGKCIAVCDVSGSMCTTSGSVTPISVCVGLGLLMAELAEEPFGKQVITFESNPKFCLINGKTLRDKCQQICSIPWGGSTNLQGAFKLILDKCKMFNLSAEHCPTTIFVFSDMQFNKCVEGARTNELTNYEAIRAQYEDAGYAVPKIVFWNLAAATSNFPVTNTQDGVALVSGFSPSLMKLFMEGQNINPFGIMKQAIDDPRYAPINLTNTEPADFSQMFYGNRESIEQNKNIN